jgi:hypothetical protein
MSGAHAVTRDELFGVFTAALSPRRRIRVDATGAHSYHDHPLPEHAPTVPHALYLTDAHLRYRLVVLDLDSARHGPDAVQDDLRRVRRWLAEAGIDHVVAQSGSPGGRHVWIGTPEGASASLVAQLALALARLLPTLDHGVLVNPRTGAVRPPGALHRAGGASALDPEAHGRGGVVTAAAARQAADTLRRGASIAALEYLVVSLPHPGHVEPAAPADADARVIVDEHGMPCLAGTRHALSAATQSQLRAPLPIDADASGRLWSVLLGAAVARHRYADVLGWLDDATITAVEHARSQRHTDSGRRIDRPVSEQHALMRRQWERAVTTASRLPSSESATTDDIDTRAADVVDTVAAVLAEAAAIPWRWASAAGPADLAVLQALCLMCLRACRIEVDLDVRRWAELAGHSRSTVSRAPPRLSAEDDSGRRWLHRVAPSDGSHAARWRLLWTDPGDSAVDSSGTQGKPAPAVLQAVVKAKGGPAGGLTARGLISLVTEVTVLDKRGSMSQVARTDLLSQLTEALEHTRNDVWAFGKGLGHHAARAAWEVRQGATDPHQVATRTGCSSHRTEGYLQALRGTGLLLGQCRLRWTGRTEQAARRLGVAGLAARRAHEHTVDRELHAWWRDELAWRRRRGKQRRGRGRPAHPSQIALATSVPVPQRVRLGPFPARPEVECRGRADYPSARALVHLALGLRPHTTQSRDSAAPRPRGHSQ